jgi:hypothetical protein
MDRDAHRDVRQRDITFASLSDGRKPRSRVQKVANASNEAVRSWLRSAGGDAKSRAPRRDVRPNEERPRCREGVWSGPRTHGRGSTPRTSAIRRGSSRPAGSRTPTAAMPMAIAGIAGLCRTTTTAPAVTTASVPRRTVGRSAGVASSIRTRSEPCSVHNNCGSDGQRGRSGRPHVGDKLATAEIHMTEDDQVGQVRTGQESDAI